MTAIFRKRQSGQALLIVLLSMAVVMTVVLSILSGSVTDIKITTHEEEALRAFSAAEAGVEKALIAGSPSSGSIGTSAFNANVTNFAQGGTNFVYPVDVVAGDTITFWLVEHAADGSLLCDLTHKCFTGRSLRFCWGKTGTAGNSASAPAIEMSIFYTTVPGDFSTTKIARSAYDPNAARVASNSFAAPDGGTCTLNGVVFPFQKTIDLSTIGIPAGSYGVANGLQMARVRVLYNTTQAQNVAIDANFPGNSTLPSQGNKIDSTGTAGDSTRRVEVLQTYADLPPIFDSTAFSTIAITK